MSSNPNDWLITPSDFPGADADGRPFGDGSERAQRLKDNKPGWDEGCNVQPLIGGLAAMNAIRAAFEAAIDEAVLAVGAGTRVFGDCGHVYLAGWRFNPNRDMSDFYEPWGPATDPQREGRTALGLVRRLMEAGVKVRMLLWFPFPSLAFGEHKKAHLLTAASVEEINRRIKLQRQLPPEQDDIGVVFLDTRVVEGHSLPISSHHQKLVVVRGVQTHVAFCGGVDLAYTRRDAPERHGDWQSGTSIPSHADQIGTLPPGSFDSSAEADLPDVYGATRQIWHDQHLKLEGPVVATLENVFVERWNDPAASVVALDPTRELSIPVGGVISSTPNAVRNVSYARYHRVRGRRSYLVHPASFEKASLHVTFNDDYVGPGPAEDVSYYGLAGQEISFVNRTGQTTGVLRIQYERTEQKPLPPALPPSSPLPASTSPTIVQTWLTVPFRPRARPTSAVGGQLKEIRAVEVEVPTPYTRGEFSIMAGLSKACNQARELIFIFDQYFWSAAYARLLAENLAAKASLRLVIVLPPFADVDLPLQPEIQHGLRLDALRIFNQASIRNRVAIYIPWHRSFNEGIYCHAKVQIFDDKLLVCGSANINERSFTNDTEVACAVFSEEIARDHYVKLWSEFFGFTPPFPVSIGPAGWGKQLFDWLDASVLVLASDYVRPDPGPFLRSVSLGPATRSSVLSLPLDPAIPVDPLLEPMLEPIHEPVGIANDIYEVKVGLPTGGSRLPTTADIVERIEGANSQYWRRPIRDV